jgi:hypothetical protein
VACEHQLARVLVVSYNIRSVQYLFICTCSLNFPPIFSITSLAAIPRSISMDDICYVPIRRDALFHLALQLPSLLQQEPFTTDGDWLHLGSSIINAANDAWDDALLYCSPSPSYSLSSSPTLGPTSSRATSLLPDSDFDMNTGIIGTSGDDNDMDAPADIRQDLGTLGLDPSFHSLAPLNTTAKPEAVHCGTKQHHPDSPEPQNEDQQVRLLRGGWSEPNCQTVYPNIKLIFRNRLWVVSI